MDDFFFKTFIDSIPAMDKEQQLALGRALDQHFPHLITRTVPVAGVDATAFGDSNRTILVGTPAPPSMSPLRKALEFKSGDRVMVTGNISPAYLKGQQGTVSTKDGSTISGRTKMRVMVKLDNKVGRFGNTYPIGVPVDCLVKLPL